MGIQVKKENDDYRLKPDKMHYRFLKMIEVDADPEDEDKARLFSWLEPELRVRLVRDGENTIRIDYGFVHGSRIGLVSRKEAEEWGPVLNSGICFAGWIKSLDRSRRKIQIDVYQRISFSFEGITSIDYHETGYFGLHIFVRINVRKRTFQYFSLPNVIDGSGSKRESVIHFSQQEWNDFAIPALQLCNFPAWNDTYINPSIMDGTQWEMQIRKGRGKVQHCDGSNDYPEEYGFFRKFVSDCLGLDKSCG